jgi:hypothetical protein
MNVLSGSAFDGVLQSGRSCRDIGAEEGSMIPIRRFGEA